jgi:hypothetical protein
MTQKNSMDALSTIVDVLTPLPVEERTRLMRAAMVLLGGELPAAQSAVPADQGGNLNAPPKAAVWMRQNGLTEDQLQQAFHIADGSVDVIGTLPGGNKKEQTYNAYILAGISQLLLKGDPSFDDKTARALCGQAGCYDKANHSAHIAARGNEFNGSKEKGWTLTAPGLKRGAEIVKQMQSAT